MGGWKQTRIVCLLIAAGAGLFVCFRRPDTGAMAANLDLAAMRELARGGAGYLVWERKIGGVWEIWTKPLDGEGSEWRLVPPEEGRDHFCPKISPDGRKLAYMSYARGTNPYEDTTGTLWLFELETRKSRLIAAEARSYREDRAVVWFDDDRLCQVDAKGNAVEVDLRDGSRKQLTRTPSKFGWLVSPDKRHATGEDPAFSVLDEAGAVHLRPRQGGCQPYFSSDGRWGFWMGGPGGPVNRMFLPTRSVDRILDRDDAVLPADRNYVYFPMISSNRQLLAFGASSDAHDHFASDYDIFVMRTDPETLDPIGKPVRYTRFGGNDRYPDVHGAELPLGSRYLEGSVEVEWQSPDGLSCRWVVDGREEGSGVAFQHVFATQGDHWIEARTDTGKSYAGLVHIREPQPPELLVVRRIAEDALSLTFNEGVDVRAATVESGSGQELKWGEVSAENHVVRVVSSKPLAAGETLTIRGVRDRAMKPNVMPDAVQRLPGAEWPDDWEGVVVAWEDRRARSHPGMEEPPARSGKAFWNARGGMDVRGGVYELPGVGKKVLRECGQKGAFTLEALITPMVPPFDKAMRPVLSLEDEHGNVKLALLQRRSAWSVWLATEDNPRGTSIEQELAPARAGMPQHLVMGYEGGRFLLCVDGNEVWVRSRLKGGLSWRATDGRFRIGACSRLDDRWMGTVEQLAVYSRVRTRSEAMACADHASPKLQSQRGIKTRKVVARLVETSRIPMLEEINPYREALVEHLYEVLPKDPGDEEQSFPVGSRIAIAHWAWAKGESAVTGEVVRLFVEPRSAHAELNSLVMRSDFAPGAEAASLLDVSNW